MPCCSTGRDTGKSPTGASTDLSSVTLQNVTDNGRTTTHDIEIEGDLTVGGYFIGDGSQLSNLSGQGSVTPTLQQVTTRGGTTTDSVTFSNPTTSFETSGNVSVSGNVTASVFYGDGSNITSVASQTDLDDNSSRINTLNQKKIITNTSGITSDFSKGDLVYASTNGNLSNLGISATQDNVLTVSGTGVPQWTDVNSLPAITGISSKLTSLESNIILSSTSGISGFQTGDIIYASSTNTLERLPIGTAGQILAVDQTTGLPTWVNPVTACVSVNYITESYTSGTTGRIGFHNTNPQHHISFGTSYFQETNIGTSGAKYANLVINGNIFAEFYYGDGSNLTNITVSQTSDVRAKSNSEIIVNSLDTLSKLKPYVYEKNGLTESGFIAQDIYYDAPELRHLVQLGKDANPNETKNEPNYEDWGEEHAKLDYVGLISYTVAAINELREMVEELENA
jgi:hypothetical protein